jgi:hypothetical protein
MSMHIFLWVVKCYCNFIMRVEVIEIQIPFEIKKDLEIRKVFLFSNLNWAKTETQPSRPLLSFPSLFLRRAQQRPS